MNHRFVTQMQESPYHALRGYSRKGGPYKNADVARRIVTENEVTTGNTPSYASHKLKQPRFGTRKSTTNHTVQDSEDLQLLIGIQSNKDPNNINNFNNIHINIHHNEFVNNKKYFPTLKGKFPAQGPILVPHKYQKVQTQPEELISRTPLSTKPQQPANRSYNQSSSLHENPHEVVISKEEQRSASSHIQQSQQKKRLITNESFDGATATGDAKNYQNMIISQIRFESFNNSGIAKHKSIDDSKRTRLSQSTKHQNSFTQTKKGNYMIDLKQSSMLDQSIEVVDTHKNYQIPMTTSNATKHSITPSQQRSHHQSFSQTSQPQQKINNPLIPNTTKNQNYQNDSQNESRSAAMNAKAIAKPKQQFQDTKKPIDIQNETLNQNSTTISGPPVKRVHPKVLWDMSDEEWSMFGDRFPIQFDKKKLLGRGGFSLVWLGEHRKTKEKFAIKQILSNNTHQSHMKEIWFGTFFFDQGMPKDKFQHFPGSRNLVRFLAYDVKPQDTWIFYEICGESLGNHLYDLRGETHGQERIYRIHHRSLYQTLRKDNTILKKILVELAQALDLLSDQRIVHSDLKTENILIKTEKLSNGMHQVSEIKLIDYGSSFPFDDLKQFSMATPEYMCPEILNYILYENSLNYHQSLLKYLVKYQKPWVIDVWSLGCVMLEMISGIPLWMSLKTLVNVKGKEQIEYGLFAVKGRLFMILDCHRVFEKIIERQIEVVSNLEHYLENQTFGEIGITVDTDIKYLLKRMLALNPEKRISPKEIIQYLEPKSQILHTQ